MKKLYPLIFIVSPLFILSSCGNDEKIPHTTSYETFVTQAGTITLHDSIIASVEGGTTSELAFKNGGRITEVLVHPGDTVQKGQILAHLGNNESDIMLNGLSEVAGGLADIQVDTENMQEQTELMKQSIERLYDERIAQAEDGINQLKNELTKNEKDLSDTVGNLNQNYILQLNNLINLANSSLYEGDKILGLTPAFENLNTTWESYLGMRSGTAKTDTEDAWNTLTKTLSKLRDIKNSHKEVTSENAKEYIQILENAYKDLIDYHEKMVFMLENSILGGGLTYELREGWTTMFNTYKTNTAQIEGGFTLWKSSITQLLASGSGSQSTQEISLESLRIQIQNAEKNKNILLAEKASKIRELNVSIIEIKSKHGELGTKIAETKMNEFLAYDANESDIIRAPYDGIILEKYMNIGNIIGQGNPLFRMTSEDKTMLKTYIDNSLYDYKVGDILHIRDPLRDLTLTGTISLLQKERDPIHNKNYTEITLSGSGNIIGERLIIELSRKKSPHNNGTIVPVDALITRYGPPGVYVLENGRIQFQLIEILSSDLSFAEIIGLKDGSTIITQGKENIYDGMLIQTLSGE